MRQVERIVAAALAGVVVSGAAAQKVQWRTEDGGNGHWYEAVSFKGDVLSWEDSQSRAEEIGGHLATFTSEAETFGYLSADPDVNLNEAWIGLFQNFDAADFQEPAGGWEWATGEPLDWINWDSGEPNNSTNNKFGGEHWGVLRINFGTPGTWNDYVPDYAGGARNGYIIEWSADCNEDGIVDYGQILDGTLADADGNGVPDLCEICIGDLNGDGVVGPPDLGILLAVWGTDGTPNGADINGDGTVNASDLGPLLGAWGVCP